MMDHVLQVIMGTLGSLGFSLLFNVRGKKLLLAALGGGLSWTLFLLLQNVVSSEFTRYVFCSLFVAIYAEFFARRLKTPATTFLIPSVIPHIPGGALYHTMRYALNKEWSLCFSQALYTLQLALGLALGIAAVLSVLGVMDVIKHKVSRSKEAVK